MNIARHGVEECAINRSIFSPIWEGFQEEVRLGLRLQGKWELARGGTQDWKMVF